MFKKTLSLVVMFVLFLGVNTSNAQETTCPELDHLSELVEAVMNTELCGDDWQAPKGLENKIDQLCVLYAKEQTPEVEAQIDKLLYSTQWIVLCAFFGNESNPDRPQAFCAYEPLNDLYGYLWFMILN